MARTQEELRIVAAWESTFRRARMHFDSMSREWSVAAREMGSEKVRPFVSQPAPASEQEMARRNSQAGGLESIVRGIRHIESMLSKYPHRGSDRLRLIGAVCEFALPNNRTEETQLFGKIAQVDAELRSIAADEHLR